jgi:hypothetical protein
VLACIYLWLIAHDGEAPKKTAICWRARRDAVRSFLRQRRGRVRPVSSP